MKWTFYILKSLKQVNNTARTNVNPRLIIASFGIQQQLSDELKLQHNQIKVEASC